MTDHVCQGESPLIDPPRLVVEPASELSARLLARARRQHREGVTELSCARSGLPALDLIVPHWWGLSLVVAGERAGKTALLSRIALETARAGGRVLWLAADGRQDTPVLRMLARGARVPVRRVFVDRRLDDASWAALDEAARELSSLPLLFADAHGATLDELCSVATESSREGALALVVLDGLRDVEVDRALLVGLEALAEDLGAPVLASIDLPPGASRTPAASGLREDLERALRPGSLVLRLTPRAADVDALPDTRAVELQVHRRAVGQCGALVLGTAASTRWVESASSDGPEAR